MGPAGLYHWQKWLIFGVRPDIKQSCEKSVHFDCNLSAGCLFKRPYGDFGGIVLVVRLFFIHTDY